MAWPKRGTRKIVVDGEKFLWHVSGCVCCARNVCTAGKAEARFVLFIDPVPWIGAEPGTIAAAIRWAREQGWSAEAGATRALAWNTVTSAFEWLADGERRLVRKTPTQSFEGHAAPSPERPELA